MLGQGKQLSIRRLLQWGTEIWRWLAEGKLVFMCFLVIAAATILGFVTWHSESSIRSSGYVLQFIGMIFAIRGLLSIREHFGQPLLRVLLVGWFKRFPKLKKNVVVGVGTVQLPMIGVKGRAEVWESDDPKKPIEQRVERILRNIERIRDEQRIHSELIDKLKGSHEEHKKKTTEQTKKMEEDIREELESLHTSDLITSLVGLVWLLVGITMSTMAPELYQWLYLP
jgi:hypothetical protein